MKYYKLDMLGNAIECDFMESSSWLATHEDRRLIAITQFPQVVISTIFLGVDLSMPDEPPKLFESLVSGVKQYRAINGIHARYTTRAEALNGHARMVAKLNVN